MQTGLGSCRSYLAQKDATHTQVPAHARTIQGKEVISQSTCRGCCLSSCSSDVLSQSRVMVEDMDGNMLWYKARTILALTA